MALAEPEVAVIVVVPLATAATRPVDVTLATEELEDDQATDAPLIVAPFWSPTVAVSCWVSPTDEKLSVVDESMTVVATGPVSVGESQAPRMSAPKRSGICRIGKPARSSRGDD